MMAAQPARAWGPGGHMMVADIAYGRLNANAKAQVDKLISITITPAAVTQKSLDFVNASHWPDDLRDAKYKDDFASTFPLHFVDFPFSNDSSALPATLPEPANILMAIAYDVHLLRTSTDEKERAKALRFLIHFVGDVQQPLHCASLVTKGRLTGDQGGNLFTIKIPAGGAIKDQKLHGYWDGGIGDFPKPGPPPTFVPPSLTEVATAAKSIMTEFPDTNQLWKRGGPFHYEQWAAESFDLAQRVVYNIKPNTQPSSAYNTTARKTARERVAWGGYRLAELLNTIWPQ
jgi:hypothetical protein